MARDKAGKGRRERAEIRDKKRRQEKKSGEKSLDSVYSVSQRARRQEMAKKWKRKWETKREGDT